MNRKEALVETAVARVLERLRAPLELDTLSPQGMLAVGYGLPLGEEAAEILAALEAGRQVRIRAQGLTWRDSHRGSPGLRALWRQGERRLTALGVELLEPTGPGEGRRPLVTLARAEELARQGSPLPPQALLTPSAADFWREKDGCS